MKRRWWASAGCRPQIRQEWVATDLTWSRSRFRRGSGNVKTLLSIVVSARGCSGALVLLVLECLRGASGFGDRSAAAARPVTRAAKASSTCWASAGGQLVLLAEGAVGPQGRHVIAEASFRVR